MAKFKKGDVVRLKRSVQHTCPEGRDDNATAAISVVYGQNEDRLMMDRDLRGCLYWNEQDVELVKVA